MPLIRPTTTDERTLWTFADAVDRLGDLFKVLESGRQASIAKEAVVTAYNDIANWHEWKYLKRRRLFNTEASYSTGTIAFDLTGGAYERVVTLTDGTWPANAALGVLRLDQAHYRVDARKNGTELTLLPEQCPAADVASGTSYEWYRESYPVPVMFRREHGLIMPSIRRELSYLQPEHFLGLRRAYGDVSEAQPQFYTILNDAEYYNNLQLLIGPSPSTAFALEFIYDAYPRPLVTHEYSTGTVSVSSGDTAVTGVGTAFADAHVGSVIRFSSTTSVPTSVRGTNPYAFQRTVTAVGSATTLTIDAAAPSAISAKAYTISDPLDIEAGSMLTAFWRLCELETAQLLDRDEKDIARREQRFRSALYLGMDADRRSGQMNSSDAEFDLVGTVTSHPE